MPSVVFVCLGNICRSPSAEGVFQALVDAAGLTEKISVDSAGTGGWHVGDPPDARARRIAKEFGYDLSAQRARQFQITDFDKFDYVIAMDQSNFENLQRLAHGEFSGELGLMLDYAGRIGEEVPDPYYGEIEDYRHVFDLLKPAAEGLLAHIRETHTI